MTKLPFLLLPLAMFSLAACPAQHLDTGAHEPLASAVIGPEGGTLAAEGVALVVPAGALASPTELSVDVASDEPDYFGLSTPVYQFEPEGLVFALPAEVIITVAGGAEATLFWSRTDGSGFEAISAPGTGELHGETTHFSQAFGGTDCHPTALPGSCECIAEGAENGGRLCRENPGDGSKPCPPGGEVFLGSEGDTCAGVGLMPKFETRCYCFGDMTGKKLCPVPPDPPFSNPCPAVGGTQSYLGPAPGGCFGYYVAQDQNGDDYPQGESGSLGSCVSTKVASEWKPAQGILTECYGGYDMEPTIPPPPGVPNICGPFYGEEP